jgi:hypothetical protein
MGPTATPSPVAPDQIPMARAQSVVTHVRAELRAVRIPPYDEYCGRENLGEPRSGPNGTIGHGRRR